MTYQPHSWTSGDHSQQHENFMSPAEAHGGSGAVLKKQQPQAVLGAEEQGRHLKAFRRHVNLYQTQVVRQITFLWHLWLIKPFIASLNILTTPVMYQICVGTLGIWGEEDVIWLLRVYSPGGKAHPYLDIKVQCETHMCRTLGRQKMSTGSCVRMARKCLL